MNTKRLIVLAMSLMLLQTSAIARQPNEELSSTAHRDRMLAPAEVTEEKVERDLDNFWNWLMTPSDWFVGAERNPAPTEEERM